MSEPVSSARQRLAFPLDFPTLDAARPIVDRVAAEVGVLKVGLELFVRYGPDAVSFARERVPDVFLDLKLHDIPATVDRAVASAAALGARWITVHATGGPKMVEAAATRAAREGTGLTVLAVTVLTSLDEGDLRATGISRSPADQALALAEMAHRAGARGFVCSPLEARAFRAALGADVDLVTPGVRPAGAATGDQKRVSSPGDAIRNGSSLLVVGRPIRDAPDPAAAARSIVGEIAEAERDLGRR